MNVDINGHLEERIKEQTKFLKIIENNVKIGQKWLLVEWWAYLTVYAEIYSILLPKLLMKKKKKVNKQTKEKKLMDRLHDINN